MKYLVFFLSITILPQITFAEENSIPKHIIELGGVGTTFYSLAEDFDTDSDKGFKNYTTSEANLMISYNYILKNGLMIGGLLRSENKTEKYEIKGDGEYNSESNFSALGIRIGYNFTSNDYYNSWWIAGTLASGSSEFRNEFDDETDPTEDTDTKVKATASSFSVEIGKRISLDNWGIKNLSYAPSIIFESREYGKDYKDAGLKKSRLVQLNIINFNVLF